MMGVQDRVLGVVDGYTKSIGALRPIPLPEVVDEALQAARLFP